MYSVTFSVIHRQKPRLILKGYLWYLRPNIWYLVSHNLIHVETQFRFQLIIEFLVYLTFSPSNTFPLMSVIDTSL
jgi:hypothetical protein